MKLPIQILAGEQFGKWTVIEEVTRGKNNCRRVYCRCECGTEKVLQLWNLYLSKFPACATCHSGRPKNPEPYKVVFKAEYKAWVSIKSRCQNPNDKNYKGYGARGIQVCGEWRTSFPVFIQEMGFKPSVRHSIERLDVNGNYEFGNCRWALPVEQMRNTSRNRKFTIDGETKCMAEWAEIAGIKYGTLASRIKRGWSPTDAILIPVNLKGKKNIAF